MRNTGCMRFLSAALAGSLILAACAQDEDEDLGAAEETEETTETEDSPDTDDDEVEGPDRGDDEPLRVGYILPETGGIAFLGPGTIGAVELAIEEINEAGGVLGDEVTLFSGDEGGADGVIANQSADRLITSERVHAVVGALASGVILQIIDRITESETVMCAPAGTSPVFTGYHPYHFRAAGSDLLLAPVIAEVMVAEGNRRVAYLSRADDYGRSLVAATQDATEEVGIENVEEVFYSPELSSFDAEVSQIAASDPDAVMLIAFDETASIIQRMVEAGIGPDDINVYVGSGSRNAELPFEVDPEDPSRLTGMRGVSPHATSDEDFVQRLEEKVSDLSVTLFTGEAYDCTILIALAAEAGGSTDPSVIRDNIVPLTRDGVECRSFAECRDLIADGEDVNYQGASGPLAFTDDGEPSQYTYDVWSFDEEGSFVTLETILARLPGS